MTPGMRPRNIRCDQITIQEIDSETLIYDERTHNAWCLNQVSAVIWQLCDGQLTLSEIADRASADLQQAVNEDIVGITVQELLEKGLLTPDSVESSAQAISRRAMITKAGLGAAALMPVIAALTAPPAVAQSGSVGTNAKRRRVIIYPSS